MQTETRTARQTLEALANRHGILPLIARVEVFDTTVGRWVGEASGSSVSWLLAAADEAATFYGRVRIVTTYGEMLVG